MAIKVKIPPVGESITEVQIGDWQIAEGESIELDAPLVTIESEKATVDLPAPVAGRLTKILKASGATAQVGDIIAMIEPAETQAPQAESQRRPAEAGRPEEEPSPPEVQPKAESPAPAEEGPETSVAAESAEGQPAVPEDGQAAPKPREPGPARTAPEAEAAARSASSPPGREQDAEVVPMSALRRTVARRLVEAQRTMAILTTFNEIDMAAVVALRKELQEAFQARHRVKLGFMSFFVKAVIAALREQPRLNAEVRGQDIVLHRAYDIGVAIGGEKGLIVPPLRHAERMSFAQIEKAIADFAQRARENKLQPEELEGGTFTISNGGVYGSLLSTPIINPPQSGILGLHTIHDRPVARDGRVVIRPMMYVALSYDHRLVDGREAVTFLRRVRELIENPARLLLET